MDWETQREHSLPRPCPLDWDKTIAVFTKADLAGVVTGHDADNVPIDGLRECLWNALRGEYPDHVDSSVLEGLKLTKTKDPMTFLNLIDT